MALVAFLHHLHPLIPNLMHLRLSELLAFDYDIAQALHSELAKCGTVPTQLLHLRDSACASGIPSHAPFSSIGNASSRRPESPVVWSCSPCSSCCARWRVSRVRVVVVVVVGAVRAMGYEDDLYIEGEDGNDEQHIRFLQQQRHTTCPVGPFLTVRC